MILEICYQGGIIGGILLIVFIKNIIMKLDNIKDVKLYNFAVWIILTYFVALFTEVYSFEVILWVFTVISNLWRLNNCQRNEEGG